MSTIGEKLEILLSNNKMTQTDLAKRIFVTRSAVSSWVRNINIPSLATIKQLCEIFYIPIQEFTNDELDIPEYFELGPWDAYIEYGDLRQPGDSVHTIIDADLAYEGMLHRFTNRGGAECSAIYRGREEIWWHYRDHEAKMIQEWNRRYNYDR